MTTETFPMLAQVERYDDIDCVGALKLETGEVVRFGRTVTKSFEPKPGMTVYVNGLGPHRMGGRKALSVRRECITEQEAQRRAQVEKQAELDAKLRPLTEAEASLPPMPFPAGFLPSVAHIEEFLPPDAAQLLSALANEEDALGDAMIEFSLDGCNPPWSFYDPALVSFGVNGGGDVFAFHFYPPRVASTGEMPVVFWDHEQHQHFFQASELRGFLSHRLYEFAQEEETREQLTELAKRLEVEMKAPAADSLRDRAKKGLDWPLPTASGLKEVPLSPVHLRERELVQALIVAFEPLQVVEPLSKLDALYQELGWQYHQNVLRHQRADWFQNQRTYRSA